MTEQQELAINTNTSCVVAAGAGSGKTTVLSKRFLRLVSENLANCDQILTITFTKKATAEMKERIHRVLLENKMTEQLKLFPNAWISTVDSFCADVARTGCSSYLLPSDFQMLDEIDFKKQAKRLATKTIESKENHETVDKLLDYVSVDQITELLVDLSTHLNLVNPIDSKDSVRFQTESAKKAKVDCIKDFKDSAEELIDLVDDIDSFKQYNEILRKAVSLMDSNTPEALALDLKTGLKGSKDIQSDVSRLKKQISKAKEQLLKIQSAIDNEDFAFKFYNLVSDFENRINKYKIETSSVTFADIMQIAIDILTKNKVIRRKFKNLFKYVMIDEFQDNNDDYRKLLYLFCEKNGFECDGIPTAENLENGKIFLVGDEKQSIYRFRGADVSVFKRMSDEIRKSGGQLIELGQNFRSEPYLVKTFNSLFSEIMDNASEDYEAVYRQLGYREQGSVKSKIAFNYFIRPWKINYNSYREKLGCEVATSVQSEAYSVAKLINRMIGTDSWLVEGEDKKPRRPRYNEIAILFRNSTHQADYEKALRLSNIPYTVAEARATMQEAVINDFYSILNLAVYPYDRISEAAVENSPVCGKESALEIAEDVRRVLSLGSIAKAVNYIWNDLSYRQYIISNPSNQVYEEHFDYLYSLAGTFDSNNWNIVKFLDYLRPLLGSQKKTREEVVLREQSRGVQIMTIHKSKGLEFPIVILVGMFSMGSGNENGFSFAKQDNRILLPSVPTDKGLQNISNLLYSRLEQEKEDAELKRLFYVAATRAKTHLVFSSDVYEKDRDEEKRADLSDMFVKASGFDRESGRFTKEEYKDIEVSKYDIIPLDLTLSKQRLDSSLIEKNKKWFKNCEEFEVDYSPEKIGVTSISSKFEGNTSGNKEILPKLKSDEAIVNHGIQTEFGTYVHSLIEASVKGEDPGEFAVDELSDSELTQIIKDAHTLAENFTSSRMLDEIKKEYKQLYSELRFQLFDEELDSIVEGAMDFVAVNEKRVLVIDFKTDSVKDPSIHENQLSWYKKASSSLFEGKEVSAKVVYLREKL